ncbi:MAG UNVERIFIED_CONTAM: hypothetical protein LVT10_05825 [Anaerolineae bacterium]|jgi:hypothetical protein
MTHDGVILTAQDEATSRATIERVLHMHAALGYYNGQPPNARNARPHADGQALASAFHVVWGGGDWHDARTQRL